MLPEMLTYTPAKVVDRYKGIRMKRTVAAYHKYRGKNATDNHV